MGEPVQIIAISGKSGCGNTSVSKLVAEKLNFRFINFTLRNLAQELNIPLSVLLEKAKSDFTFDLQLDNKQKQLAHEGNSVIGSRLAVWLFPEAILRVFLYADLETRAQRIVKREKLKDFETVLQETSDRDLNDNERFMQLYNINNNQYDFVDLIINTTYYTPDSIADLIVSAYSIAAATKQGGHHETKRN